MMPANERAVALQMAIGLSPDHEFALRNLDRLSDGITKQNPQMCIHGTYSFQ